VRAGRQHAQRGEGMQAGRRGETRACKQESRQESRGRAGRRAGEPRQGQACNRSLENPDSHAGVTRTARQACRRGISKQAGTLTRRGVVKVRREGSASRREQAGSHTRQDHVKLGKQARKQVR
jgi:hypothetical protein